MIPVWRKVLYSVVVVVAFFGTLELILALVGLEPPNRQEDPYVSFSSSLPLFVPAGDGKSLETAPAKLALFNQQRFSRKKASGVRRVFTLGGSTTYGRPFDDATSFSGWLRAYLDEAQPGRWEVINAGGISYASYRVAALMEELLSLQPDLFILYTGNNEFLERRTYGDQIEEPEALQEARTVAQRSRLYTLGQKLLGRGPFDPRRQQAQERYRLSGEVKELLDSSAGLDAYVRDEAFESQVLSHYRFNLQRMVQQAQAAEVAVVVVTVPVNEKDFEPFKSQHGAGVSPQNQRRVAELLDRARRVLNGGTVERDGGQPALDDAVRAAELDPRYAESQFLLGRSLAQLGRHPEASAAYALAIQEDVCPLRALPKINVWLRQLVGVRLVDFEAALREHQEARAGHRTLGDEDFLDHVHPTLEAHGLLAGLLAETLPAVLEDSGLEPGWHRHHQPRVAARVLARADDAAYARAYKNLSKVLIWAGKEEAAEKYVRLAGEALADDWEVRYNHAVVALAQGDRQSALDALDEALALKPDAAPAHDQKAVILAAAGDLSGAIAAGRRAVELAPANAGGWNNLSAYLLEAGGAAEAERASRKALELEPDFAEAHNNLGNVLLVRGPLTGAINAYQRAVLLRPAYPDAWSNLGRAWLGAGDLPAAVAAFEKAVAQDHRRGDDWEALARSKVSLGDEEGAREAVSSGLRELPSSPALLHLKGRMAAGDGDFEAAAGALEAALGADPARLGAWLDLSRVHLARQSPAEAVATLRRGLAAAPTEADGTELREALALLTGNGSAGGRP